MAQQDAEADRFNFFSKATEKKRKSPKDIIALYKDKNPNAACFTNESLWRIYDSEYGAHQYHSWIPVGVLLFVGSIIGLALNDIIKKWFSQFLEAIGSWFYKQLAGTSLIENFALNKYRQALINKYQKLNIIFRPNHPLEMREVYVPLKVAGTSDRNLLEANDAIRQYRRLMVTGEPGSGKSMLLRYLVLSHAEGRLAGLSDRPVPILLELHRLSDPNLTAEMLEQQLIEACERSNFPKANRFVSKSLKQGRLMLLLDGLDEVNSSVRSHVVQRIKDLLDKYKKCRAIITCRTAVYNQEFTEAVEQTLEIVEFSDRQIRYFLRAWKSQMPAGKSVEQLIQTLQDRAKILALARNPLLLTIIAYLYTDTPFVLPHSRAEFYTKATDLLLELRDQDKNLPNQYRGVDKRRIIQHLALYAQDSANQQQQDRRSLPYEVVLEQVQGVLPSLNLPSEATRLILDEIVNRSGLLLAIDNGQRYQFAHLTLQEYFAAAALRDKQSELIQRLGNKSDDWRETVKLWCGLANNSTALIEAVYKQDKLTGFECLADAQEVEQEVVRQIVDDFKVKLGQDEDDEIISAFGSVAADFRPRGRELFEFLADKLASSKSLACRKAAAKALSLTNLSQAVEVLANSYSRCKEELASVNSSSNISFAQYNAIEDLYLTLQEALIRMGDLAVPQLQLLAEQGFLAGLSDLKKIATPQAAIALVPFLWHSDFSFAYRAAWHLAELLHQLEIEETLRGYSLTQAQQQAKFFDWIWQPFGEPTTSALPLIAGRIAHLINCTLDPQIPIESIPRPIPAIDPRLMVPICSIVGINCAKLPQKWNFQANTLLEQQSLDPNLEQKLQEQIKQILGANNNTRWGLLLSSLVPRLQLDLLHRLIVYRRPEKNDWRNLFKKIKYEFKKSLHYRLVLIIAFLLSLGDVIEIFIIMARQPANWLNGLMALAIWVLIAFWYVLWQEIKEKLEPNLLMRFGFLGLWTFGREWQRLLRKNLVWERVTALYMAVSSGEESVAVFVTVFGAGIVAVFVASAGAVGVAVALALAAGAVARAGAGAVGGANGAEARAGAGAVAGAVAGVGILAVIMAVSMAVNMDVGGVAGAGSVAVAVAVALAAGLGLGAWDRAKEKTDFIRFLSVLAVPWFCWLPIVVGCTSFAAT